MFKWRRSSKTEEPKTPKLPTIHLPDSQNAFIPYHQQQYIPNSHSNYQAAPAMTSVGDPWYNLHEPPSTTPSQVKGMLDGPPLPWTLLTYM